MKQVEITSKIIGRGGSTTSASPSLDLSGYALISDLLNYVTISGNEDVTGLHDFVNGLKVGGIELIQKNGNAFLKGNLVVEGGITMYGDGEGGSSVPLYSTLGSLENVDKDAIDAVASVDRVLFQSAGSNVWTWKALSEIGGGSSGGSVSGDYLPLSGGTIKGSVLFEKHLLLTALGNGTYNIGSIGVEDDEGFNLEAPLDGDSCESSRMPIHLTWRGGYVNKGGLRITNSDEAYLGGNKILHAGNYSSYALPLSGGTLNNGTNTPLVIKGIAHGSWIAFYNQSDVFMGSIGFQADNQPYAYHTDYGACQILHSGNFSSYALPLSGGTCKWINIDYTNSLGAENSVFIIKRKDRGRFIEFQGDVGFFKCVYNFTHTSTNVDIHVFNKGTSYISKLQTASVCPNLDIGGGSVTIGDWGGSKFYFDTENIRLGIGTPKPNTSLHVNGSTLTKSIGLIEQGEGLYRIAHIGMNSTYGLYIEAGTNADSWQGTLLPMFFGWRGATKGMILDGSKNLLVYGGITMYSDQRKKTILNHVELSLKQIADAPLIEHYYNSDQNKTTHVGSIAQYWASMNDWFCKLDNEGYYTMEIQNCALASVISVARHLERYESKTDKTIRKMKQRIQELEEEVERLKQN